MYESPLNKLYGDIQSRILKQDEENMMYAINQAVGYNVDKQELIKALNYDREQYKKGYADAMSIMNDIKAEIEKKARINEIGGRGSGKSIRYGLCMALEIIDKYKIEREANE